MDNRQSENFTWAFSSGELKTISYISLSQKHRTVGLNRWKLIWTDVLVGKIGPDVRWLCWLGFKFYFPYYWFLLPPAIFNANDFVPEVCGRRKHVTIKRKTMRKTGSQNFLTSGGGRDGVWAFVQDIVQITQRILKSCYIGWMDVDEKGHFQKVKIYIKTKCQVSIESDVSVFEIQNY